MRINTFVFIYRVCFIKEFLKYLLIQETIPSLVNGLKMVWIIPRHYNKDQRMVPLMQLIGNEIAEKVQIKPIFPV